MTSEGVADPSGGEVPEQQALVSAGSQQKFLVAGERRLIDRVHHVMQGGHQVARAGVPEFHLLVPPTACQPLPRPPEHSNGPGLKKVLAFKYRPM